MKISDLLRQKRDAILEIAAEHGAYDVRVFGSVARGEETEESDVDFLVKVTANPSPWFPAGLQLALEDLLGRKVDVVIEEGIYWLLRRKILKEAVPL